MYPVLSLDLLVSIEHKLVHVTNMEKMENLSTA